MSGENHCYVNLDPARRVRIAKAYASFIKESGVKGAARAMSLRFGIHYDTVRKIIKEEEEKTYESANR